MASDSPQSQSHPPQLAMCCTRKKGQIAVRDGQSSSGAHALTPRHGTYIRAAFACRQDPLVLGVILTRRRQGLQSPRRYQWLAHVFLIEAGDPCRFRPGKSVRT